MSHFVNYQMQLKDEKNLIKALKDLEYAISRNEQINGYAGQKLAVEIAAKKGSKQHIGFNQKDGNYEAVADWMYIPGGERERIQQHYSKHEVMDAFGQSRFTLKSVTEENGEIVLVGQRA